MNIVLCSDNNYAPLMGVSIYSILKENAKLTQNINFFILDSKISQVNKQKLNRLIKLFNSNIFYIDTEKIHFFIEESISVPVKSISTYYRVFLCTLLPKDVDKLIYFDCDSLICNGLEELWNIDIEDFHIAGVVDVIPEQNKTLIGLKNTDYYFNAGMLLINLKRWREENLENKMIEFVNFYKGAVRYHDQGIINGVCTKKKVLNPKFNVLTPFLTMNKKQIIHYHKLKNYYYSDDEIKESKLHPVFIHFVPFLTDRPWVKGNLHPLRKKYNKVLAETEWKGLRFKQRSKTIETYVKWMYKLLPYFVFINTLEILRKFKIRTWVRNINK